MNRFSLITLTNVLYRSSCLVFLLTICQLASSQDIKIVDTVTLDLIKLNLAKMDYDKYASFADTRPAQYAHLRDSSFQVYKDVSNKIKSKPEVYLKFLDSEIKENAEQLGAKKIFYGHANTIHFNARLHVISKLDYYKIVRYSLFELKEDLPSSILSVPFMKAKYDAMEPIKLQSLEDIEKPFVR